MKIKQKFKNMSIFNKISFFTIVLIIFGSIVSSSFQLIQFTENIKNKDRLLVNEAAKRIHSLMQDEYNMMYNQRTLLHSTDHIADVIVSTRKEPASIYHPENLKKITEYLAALCYSDDNILDAVIFTADGENAFSYSNASGRRIYLNYDYNTLPYIEAFHDASETILTVYDEAPPYLTLTSKGDPGVISFIGKIYNMNYPTKQIITGYLMINFSPASIDEIYNEIDAASDGEYVIANGLSDIIYSNKTAYINQKYTEDFFPVQDLLSNKGISLSGLKIIAAVSDKTLSKKVANMVWQQIGVTVVIIFCLIMVIAVLHRYYKRKFQQLADAMFQISQGDFETKLPVSSKDEIGYLSQSFNSMCETLDTYIKKTYLAETQQRTAELYALQAQINPHFLANTIESIRMRALEDDNYEIAEMLSNLGKLFRWLIEFHQDIIYLEDELDYIDSYLELQKFRFGERVQTELNVPSDVLYMGFPKFILQPIVENALTHGMPNNGHSLLIRIDFQIDGHMLILTIEDNGPGMNEEVLHKLNRHIQDIQTDHTFGVAIKNVHKRIQLLFGKEYGLSVNSRSGSGTTVIVTLPAQPKKEMEKYVQNDYRR